MHACVQFKYLVCPQDVVHVHLQDVVNSSMKAMAMRDNGMLTHLGHIVQFRTGCYNWLKNQFDFVLHSIA